MKLRPAQPIDKILGRPLLRGRCGHVLTLCPGCVSRVEHGERVEVFVCGGTPQACCCKTWKVAVAPQGYVEEHA